MPSRRFQEIGKLFPVLSSVTKADNSLAILVHPIINESFSPQPTDTSSLISWHLVHCHLPRCEFNWSSCKFQSKLKANGYKTKINLSKIKLREILLFPRVLLMKPLSYIVQKALCKAECSYAAKNVASYIGDYLLWWKQPGQTTFLKNKMV